jgi:hypothetical protein
VNEWSKVYIN